MKIRPGDVTDFILGVLSAGAFITTLGTLPGILLHLQEEAKREKRSFRPRALENAFRRMERKKLLRVQKNKKKSTVELTPAGQDRLKRLEINDLQIHRSESWDRQWRLVLFDIPEQYKRARDALGLKLKQLGMYRLHKSVFVFPGKCEDEIEFLSAFFEIEPYVTVLRTPSLGAHEASAFRHFRME